MKIIQSIVLTALLLGACSSDPATEETTAESEEVIEEIVTIPDTASKAEEGVPFLTQENHEAVLTEYWNENPERVVRLITDKGNIEIRLFDETPIHSSNFLMLAKRNYFNETLFTRVVPNFIIQGGSSDREELSLKRMNIGNFKPEPEFHDDLIHKRGAVSMARQYEDNPEKLSSPYNFFIVVGRTFNTPAILGIERDHDKSYTIAERRIYETVGGAPHLDGEHTVFGEVIEGMDVVDEISNVETDIREWPKQDIAIREVEIVQ